MPNHVTSRLRIRGSSRDLARFAETFIKKDRDGGPLFDFNAAIPMPKELEETNSGSVDIGYDAWYGSQEALDRILRYAWISGEGIKTRTALKKFLEKKHPEYKIHADKVKRNLKKYGARNWYDWSIENWGTKWNSYSFHWASAAMGPKEWSPKETGEIEFTFNTAWSVPIPVIEKAAEMFPDLSIQIWSYDEGGGFSCTGAFEGGSGSIDCDDANDEIYEIVYGEPPTPPEENA